MPSCKCAWARSSKANTRNTPNTCLSTNLQTGSSSKAKTSHSYLSTSLSRIAEPRYAFVFWLKCSSLGLIPCSCLIISLAASLSTMVSLFDKAMAEVGGGEWIYTHPLQTPKIETPTEQSVAEPISAQTFTEVVLRPSVGRLGLLHRFSAMFLSSAISRALELQSRRSDMESYPIQYTSHRVSQCVLMQHLVW